MVRIVCRSAPRTKVADLCGGHVVCGTPRSLPPGYCGEEVRVRQAMSPPSRPKGEYPSAEREGNSMTAHDSDHTPARGWSGRFSEPVAELVKLYTASVDFDQRLADADIDASLAHARMLGATGVLIAADVDAIANGLEKIRGEIARGEFAWSRDLEDVHSNIEKRLIALI